MNHTLHHSLRQDNAEKVRPVIQGAKGHLLFIGTVLFVPSFFVDLGIELDFTAVLAAARDASIAGFLLVACSSEQLLRPSSHNGFLATIRGKCFRCGRCQCRKSDQI